MRLGLGLGTYMGLIQPWSGKLPLMTILGNHEVRLVRVRVRVRVRYLSGLDPALVQKVTPDDSSWQP
jgi:hypothetical protein